MSEEVAVEQVLDITENLWKYWSKYHDSEGADIPYRRWKSNGDIVHVITARYRRPGGVVIGETGGGGISFKDSSLITQGLISTYLLTELIELARSHAYDPELYSLLMVEEIYTEATHIYTYKFHLTN